MKNRGITFFIILILLVNVISVTYIMASEQNNLIATIEQPSLPPLNPPSDAAIMGCSKALQILLPVVLVGMLLKNIKFEAPIEKLVNKLFNIKKGANKKYTLFKRAVEAYVKVKSPDIGVEARAKDVDNFLRKYEITVEMKASEFALAFRKSGKIFLGITLFKLGADMAYFSLSNHPESYTYNLPGLLSFVLVSYLGWHVIDDKLLKATLFPLVDRLYPPAKRINYPGVAKIKRIISKYLAEVDGQTYDTLPTRQVFSKIILILMFSVAWPASDVGKIWQHEGGVTLAPFMNFPYLDYSAVSLSSYISFIMGSNIGGKVFDLAKMSCSKAITSGRKRLHKKSSKGGGENFTKNFNKFTKSPSKMSSGLKKAIAFLFGVTAVALVTAPILEVTREKKLEMKGWFFEKFQTLNNQQVLQTDPGNLSDIYPLEPNWKKNDFDSYFESLTPRPPASKQKLKSKEIVDLVFAAEILKKVNSGDITTDSSKGIINRYEVVQKIVKMDEFYRGGVK